MTKKEAIRQTEQVRTLMSLGFSESQAEELRRIFMTLQRWYERGCGDSNNYASWCIVRGKKTGHTFECDDDGRPYIESHPNNGNKTIYTPIADLERGAIKRLARIMTTVPTLKSYIQTDPRGAALYILRPGDIPDGVSEDSCYSRGICVY